MFLPELQLHRPLFKHRRRIKNAEETPADHLVDLPLQTLQGTQRPQPLTGGNDRVMVRDLAVVRVARLADLPPGIARQDLSSQRAHLRETARAVRRTVRHTVRRAVLSTAVYRPGTFPGKPHQSADIAVDLLRHRTGKHAGVGSRIGHQLLFIKLLNDLQGLVRTDVEAFRAVVLDLRQVVKQRRVPDFLLLLGLQDLRLGRPDLRQRPDQRLRVLALLEPVFLVELRGTEKIRALDRLPLGFKRNAVFGKAADDPVKGCLHEIPDLPLAPHHHAQNAGHDAADAEDGAVLLQEGGDGLPVAERQGAGKVDSHEVVFLGAEISRRAQTVVRAPVLRLPDPAEDLLLGLGVDPDPFSCLAPDARHLVHQAVDVFALPPGVRADVDRVDIVPVQEPAHDFELGLHVPDHLVKEAVRQERTCLQRPALVFQIIFFRITHGDQMAHTPGDDRVVTLEISVLTSAVHLQHPRKFLRDAGLLGDKQLLQCISSPALSAVLCFFFINLCPVSGVRPHSPLPGLRSGIHLRPHPSHPCG